MVFLDSHVEDPVAYFTAVKEHAEGVLAEAEENPARFRRDAALRRENVSLRSDMAEIKNLIRGQNGKTGTPDADAAEASQPEDDDAAGRQAEGEARVSFVKEQGFKVDAVAKAWTDAGDSSRRGTPRKPTSPKPSTVGKRQGVRCVGAGRPTRRLRSRSMTGNRWTPPASRSSSRNIPAIRGEDSNGGLDYGAPTGSNRTESV